jgi:hypothetical protein
MQTINTLILANVALTVALFVVASRVPTIGISASILVVAALMRWAARNKGSAAKAITTVYLITTIVAFGIIAFRFESFVGFARVAIAVVLGLVFVVAGRAYSITISARNLQFLISAKKRSSPVRNSTITGKLQIG